MMKFSIRILQILGMFILSMQAAFAYVTYHKPIHKPTKFRCTHVNRPMLACPPDVVEARALKEEFIPLPYIGISFYKPNYFLPFYYTGSPDQGVYAGSTPNNESLKKSEAKYQISLKVPLWKNMFESNSSFVFAYTLLTYWQVWNKKSFIRSTDYEPELMVTNHAMYPLYKDWKMNFFNIGYSHQSNGFGNDMERGWDRIYVEAVTSVNNWMFTLRPWVIIHRNSNNSDIGPYLGYARFITAVNLRQHVLSLELTNIGAVAKRTSANLTWSFPINCWLKGYVEGFSGYGQSLIEYNHRTNSFGVGLALNDWV